MKYPTWFGATSGSRSITKVPAVVSTTACLCAISAAVSGVLKDAGAFAPAPLAGGRPGACAAVSTPNAAESAMVTTAPAHRLDIIWPSDRRFSTRPLVFRRYRLSAMLPHPLRAGLAGLIDYAGLFPPASLDLPTTLSHFRDYATSAEQWMLGRLIVPLPQLGALSSWVDGFEAPLRPAW